LWVSVLAALIAVALASVPVRHNPVSPLGSAESACKSAFIAGAAPANVSSPNKGSNLISLCHTKGSSVFFYTVYDSSVLHALISAQLIKSSSLAQCDGGRREFEKDPQLKALGVNQVEPETDGSGYDDQWNRGHLGPSEVFSYDKTDGGAWQQCYFTTNIAPQWYQFNQIGWRMLEANIFQWSLKNKKDIYVITGTWYNSSKVRSFSSGLSIPNYYYKVICDGSSSAAFAGQNLPNHTGMESMDYMTVASWQMKTGINFNLPSSCNIGSVNPKYWNFDHSAPPSMPF